MISKVMQAKSNSIARAAGLRQVVCVAVLVAACSVASQSHSFAQQVSQPGQLHQVEMINETIKQGWIDYEISPSKDAADPVWCRRVFLDVIGRIPSLDELQEFMTDRASRRREALVQRLLHDDRYTEEYAHHWSTVWTNLMIGRSGGMDRRDLTNRDGMMKYFRDSFAANKSYDQMVHELKLLKSIVEGPQQ